MIEGISKSTLKGKLNHCLSEEEYKTILMLISDPKKLGSWPPVRAIPESAIQRLLEECKAMCNCGGGWGEEDGHEWEILLLEKLLEEEVIEIKDDNEQTDRTS